MNYNAIYKSTPFFTLLNESPPNYPHIDTVTPLYYIKRVNMDPKPRTLTPFWAIFTPLWAIFTLLKDFLGYFFGNGLLMSIHESKIPL